MATQNPNLVAGVADKPYDASGAAYQELSTITQSSSSSEVDSDGYDYPLVHEVRRGNIKQLPGGGDQKIELFAAAPPGYISDMSFSAEHGEAKELHSGDLESVSYQLFQSPDGIENGEGAFQDSFSSSGEDGSDVGPEPGEPAVIRQQQVGASPAASIKLRSAQEAEERGSDQKIYIRGSLISNCGSHFMQLSKPPLTDEGFADEGIYQGLVMTDFQKKDLGILPESLYMTTNLIKRGDLIESLLLSTPAVAIEVPEVPLPPTSPPLFPKGEKGPFDTIPSTKPPAKPPRRGSEYGMEIPSNYIPTPSTTQRSVAPRYRDMILRPPPLPPLESGANRAEKRAYAVVENLLKSEAAYLTSLNIAITVYRTPLMEMADGPTPILSVDEVEMIFGPITKILEFQEIFYSAVTSRTLDWNQKQKIGDVLSSLSTKDVVQNYSTYVNNFTVAMAMLEKAINKKERFVQFVKERYANSRTSLSLQGLLLKPIQRFPQYIMFLQDLIRFTSPEHPDRVTLQMALARYEGIANFLNESKRQQEQKAVVQNLNHKISHLPFKLMDGKRWLYRQDIVTRLMVSGGRVVQKDRCLLLFNNMVLCAALKRRKKRGTARAKAEELESSTGSRDFQSISVSNFFYTCKWFVPLNHLEIVQPDFLNDIWDQTMTPDVNPEYTKLKERYNKLEQDILKVTQIVKIAATLHEEYKGLTCTELSNHVRVLQRKVVELREEIKVLQQGRLDIVLPSRDNDRKVHHTYAFKSERVKLDWINNLRYSKRKLDHPVSNSWVIAEDVSQGDIFEVSYKLPLFVENYSLNMINNELLSVQCAAKVGNCAWLASGDNRSAQVSIVECVTPSPLILECFKVNSKRIIDIVYVPPSTLCPPGDPLFTVRRNSRSGTFKGAGAGGTLTQLPPYMATVWLGTQCGRLVVYNAESSGEGPKQCLASIKLRDAVTSIQYYRDQVFASTAEGSILIFKRSINGFNMSKYSSVSVTSGANSAIRCTCRVGNKLWVGVKGQCFFFNMQTHTVEGSLKMNSREGVLVSKMVNQGEGVWVSYKGSSSLELFHTTSKTSLQNIDIKSTLSSIIKRHKLEERLSLPAHVHVTAIMACSGYLWIGTNVGAIMVYHIPHLESVPIVHGKPYLAMDGHVGSVRVLLTMETLATYESSRLGKFLADEQFRRNQEDEIKEEEEEEEEDNWSRDQSHDQGGSFLLSGTIRERSVSDPINRSTLKKEGTQKGAQGERPSDYANTTLGDKSKEDPRTEVSNMERSVTPVLPEPSTILGLEESTSESGRPVSGDVAESLKQQKTASENEELERSVTMVRTNGKASVYEEEYVSSEVESRKKFGQGVRPTPHLPTSAAHGAGPEEEAGTEEGEDGWRRGTLDNQALLPPTYSNVINHSLRDSGDYTIPQLLDRDRETTPTAGAEEENPYSNPIELDSVSYTNQQTQNFVKDEVYSVPHELDVTLKRGEDQDYDFPAELMHEGANPGAYEDPATLGKDPSTPIAKFFSGDILSNTLYVPGRPPPGTKEGAIFVLTAGRGLINLRPGKKATSFNEANKDTEGCMIAYEIEV